MADEEDVGDVDLAKLLAKYTPEPEKINGRYSEKLTELSRELTTKVREAEALKIRLKELHKRINSLSFRELPGILNDLGVQALSCGDGIELRLEPFFKASLPVKMDPEKRKAGLEYIRENAPDLLRVQVTMDFPAEQYEQALNVLKLLQSMDLEATYSEGVHHARLTSWVKEQFLAGEELDLEVINARIDSYVRFVKIDPETQDALDRIKKMQSQSDALPEGF
jgi:hypothetical protein